MWNQRNRFLNKALSLQLCNQSTTTIRTFQSSCNSNSLRLQQQQPFLQSSCAVRHYATATPAASSKPSQPSKPSKIKKVDFSSNSSSDDSDSSSGEERSSRFSTTKIIVIGSIVLVAFVALSEVNYYMMPEASLGNIWRKLVYGDPFRNYVSMIRGRVLYMTLPTKYHIAETPAEMAGVTHSSVNGGGVDGDSHVDDVDDERVVFISVERGFHLVVPKHFVPLGLEVKEQNSNIRGYGSVSARDIIGNGLSVEWQRAAPLFDKTQLSVYTPKKEALEHIAHYFLDQLNGVMDSVHVQRIEYLPSSARVAKENEEATSPQPLDSVPYFKEKKRHHDDLLIVVTNSKKGSMSGWQGHLFSMEYPYVYRMTLDMSANVLQFGQNHKMDKDGKSIATREELDKVASSFTKVKKLHPIIKENFEYAPSDPTQISKQLRNELLAAHFNSFHTIPSK